MEDKKQEDIDLLYVFKGLKSGIVYFLKSIKWLIDYSIKKIIPLSVFIVLFSSLGLGLYFLTTPYYKSDMSISHIRFENDYCFEMVKDLGSYIDGNGNSTLSRVLAISPKYAKEIKSIKYIPLNLNIARRYADSSSVILPFKVEVEIYDNEILDSLQKGILNYFESNEYASKIKELDEELLIKTEQRLKKEISSIDSLKNIVDQSIIPRSTGNGIVFGEPVDPVSVYKQSMEMHEKEIRLSKQKRLNNSFEVRVGFTKSAKKASEGKLIFILSGMLAGYIIGLLYLSRKKTQNTI